MNTQADVRQSIGQRQESWTPTLNCVLSPWEADGWCLFGLAAVNVHTHSHTLKLGGSGWLTFSHSLPCVDFGFRLEIFFFLKFSVSNFSVRKEKSVKKKTHFFSHKKPTSQLEL